MGKEYLIKEETLKGIADAIREKGSTTGSIKVGNMVESIKNIFIGEEVFNDGYYGLPYTKRTEISLNVPATFPSGLYKDSVHMETVDIPNLTSPIPRNMFEGCTALKSANIPKAVLANYIFSDCTSLVNVNAPLSTATGYGCFYKCSSLESVSLPNAKTVEEVSFCGCTKLKKLNFPNVIKMTGTMYHFKDCISLEEINLPLCENVGQHSFYNCKSLKKINIPNAKTFSQQGFYGCSSLLEFKFGVLPTSISNNCFSNCSNLADIYVPWAEDEVANAPWGASNATIHYNWKAESEE